MTFACHVILFKFKSKPRNAKKFRQAQGAKAAKGKEEYEERLSGYYIENNAQQKMEMRVRGNETTLEGTGQDKDGSFSVNG